MYHITILDDLIQTCFLDGLRVRSRDPRMPSVASWMEWNSRPGIPVFEGISADIMGFVPKQGIFIALDTLIQGSSVESTSFFWGRSW